MGKNEGKSHTVQGLTSSLGPRDVETRSSLAKTCAEPSWQQLQPFPHPLPSPSSFSSRQSKGTRLTYCVWGGAAAGSGSAGEEQRESPSGLPLARTPHTPAPFPASGGGVGGGLETRPASLGACCVPVSLPQPVHYHYTPYLSTCLPPPPRPTSQLQRPCLLWACPHPQLLKEPLVPKPVRPVPGPSRRRQQNQRAQKLPFNTGLITAFPPPGPPAPAAELTRAERPGDSCSGCCDSLGEAAGRGELQRHKPRAGSVAEAQWRANHFHLRCAKAPRCCRNARNVHFPRGATECSISPTVFLPSGFLVTAEEPRGITGSPELLCSPEPSEPRGRPGK